MGYSPISDEEVAMIEQVRGRSDLTVWEKEFLRSLGGRSTWTDRQKGKFDEIYEAYMLKDEVKERYEPPPDPFNAARRRYR